MAADPPEDEAPYASESTLVEHVPASAGAGPIHVAWKRDGERVETTFQDTFILGRDAQCDVRVSDSSVSRTHARIQPDGGRWYVQDLDSGNGTFLDDLRVREALIPRSATLTLGPDCRIHLRAPDAPEGLTEDELARRVFSRHETTDVGGRTEMLRKAYRQVDRKQKRRYRGIIAAIALVLLGSLGIAWYQYQVLQQTRELATQIFYSMKTIDVQIARLEDLVKDRGDPALIDEVEARRQEVRNLERQYDHFLEDLDVLGPDISKEDRVILRVARIFGECELTMPPEFVAEVKRYIHEWRLSPRLRQSLERLQDLAIRDVIVDAMLDQDLPPQFLYLALQESSFDKDAIGPKTRFGIAKGIWQFIPSTARRYGLRTGPLVELPVPDPNDDRHDPKRATMAAARYLHDIYSKDAQASGLLVMASYNWGPNNIRRRIREMPENPRERNFWELLKRGDVPKETYDYVFHIVSAIVIGENPELFGFDFDNPLGDLGSRLAQDG